MKADPLIKEYRREIKILLKVKEAVEEALFQQSKGHSHKWQDVQDAIDLANDEGAENWGDL